MRYLFKYIFHCLSARNTNGFGVHSPFMYQFTQLVIREKHYFYKFSEIEQLRSQLKNDNRILNINDFGTGHNRESKVSEVLKRSVAKKKYGQLLYRIIHYFKFNNILELGTSIGITTAYLASNSTDLNCLTFEGSDDLANIAIENFKQLNLNNITLIRGDINQTLDKKLAGIDRLDLVFIDANHTSEAVLKYFDLCLTKSHNDTVFIIDDINWSKDMEFGWKKIKEYEVVTSTIDIFHQGIVFLNKDLHKKHYKMRF